jgi:hypothetical protein
MKGYGTAVKSNGAGADAPHDKHGDKSAHTPWLQQTIQHTQSKDQAEAYDHTHSPHLTDSPLTKPQLQLVRIEALTKGNSACRVQQSTYKCNKSVGYVLQQDMCTEQLAPGWGLPHQQAAHLMCCAALSPLPEPQPLSREGVDKQPPHSPVGFHLGRIERPLAPRLDHQHSSSYLAPNRLGATRMEGLHTHTHTHLCLVQSKRCCQTWYKQALAPTAQMQTTQKKHTQMGTTFTSCRLHTPQKTHVCDTGVITRKKKMFTLWYKLRAWGWTLPLTPSIHLGCHSHTYVHNSHTTALLMPRGQQTAASTQWPPGTANALHKGPGGGVALLLSINRFACTLWPGASKNPSTYRGQQPVGCPPQKQDCESHVTTKPAGMHAQPPSLKRHTPHQY